MVNRTKYLVKFCLLAATITASMGCKRQHEAELASVVESAYFETDKSWSLTIAALYADNAAAEYTKKVFKADLLKLTSAVFPYIAEREPTLVNNLSKVTSDDHLVISYLNGTHSPQCEKEDYDQIVLCKSYFQTPEGAFASQEERLTKLIQILMNILWKKLGYLPQQITTQNPLNWQQVWRKTVLAVLGTNDGCSICKNTSLDLSLNIDNFFQKSGDKLVQTLSQDDFLLSPQAIIKEAPVTIDGITFYVWLPEKLSLELDDARTYQAPRYMGHMIYALWQDIGIFDHKKLFSPVTEAKEYSYLLNFQLAPTWLVKAALNLPELFKYRTDLQSVYVQRLSTKDFEPLVKNFPLTHTNPPWNDSSAED